MPRAALFTLLVAWVLSGSLQAQRAGAAFHANAAGHGRSGFIARHRSPVARGSAFLPSRTHRSNNVGSYFLPYGDSLGNDSYEESDAEATPNPVASPPMIPQSPAPLHKSQFIEIPSVADAAAPRMPPPAVFILASGERLEASRFLLSASLLSVSIDRRQRTVPLSLLDIHATLDANHDRGIDLRIPDDRNEISLSF